MLCWAIRNLHYKEERIPAGAEKLKQGAAIVCVGPSRQRTEDFSLEMWAHAHSYVAGGDKGDPGGAVREESLLSQVLRPHGYRPVWTHADQRLVFTKWKNKCPPKYCATTIANSEYSVPHLSSARFQFLRTTAKRIKSVEGQKVKAEMRRSLSGVSTMDGGSFLSPCFLRHRLARWGWRIRQSSCCTGRHKAMNQIYLRCHLIP